jgi:hypothetical protein
VVGGLAVSAWGRPRVTQDIDMVVDIPEDGIDDSGAKNKNEPASSRRTIPDAYVSKEE